MHVCVCVCCVVCSDASTCVVFFFFFVSFFLFLFFLFLVQLSSFPQLHFLDLSGNSNMKIDSEGIEAIR